jgi:hypothetical protein
MLVVKMKKWKEFLLELWDKYGTNPIPLKDFKNDRSKVLWISGHFWRWGLLKRLGRRTGLYAFTRFGIKCVKVLLKEREEWYKEILKEGGKYIPTYEEIKKGKK